MANIILAILRDLPAEHAIRATMTAAIRAQAMSGRRLLAVAALLVLGTVSGTGPIEAQEKDALFYYGTTETVPLTVSSSRIIVKFTADAGKNAELAIQRLAPFGKAERLYQQSFVVALQEPAKMTQALETLKKDGSVVSANPVYVTQDGQEMGVTDEICLEFKKDVGEADKKRLLVSFNAVVIPRNQPWDKHFVVISVGKDKNALEVANRIMESGLVRFAHPDFVARTYPHAHIPNDPYFPHQFYLHNTGQPTNDGHAGTADADIDAPEAWDITRGSNTITIAVIDEGVERHNNDLPAGRLVVLDGSNFASGSANDPEAVGDGAHGTCCAGIIAAEQDNSEGGSGVAPLSRVMPVRIPFGSFPASTYASAINFAWSNGADVLSNSWGYGSSADIPVITAAITNAVTQGRGGIGSVVVWSAGNTADQAAGDAGFVTYPGCVAVANVITVGASDRNDQQANYSPTDAALDVVAPSHRAYSSQIAGESWEVWSTDIVANAGYNTRKSTDGGTLPPVGETLPATGTNNLNYTGRMGGTSAACPEVAGVAALVLSLNPAFTPAQVYDAVIGSADKVGGYTYTAGRSSEMGFGRVNAFRAVAADLVVASCQHSPANPTTQTPITFTAVVQNVGSGPAVPSVLSFRVGGETPPGKTFSVPALAPGATFTASRQETLTIAQSYRNTAVADVNVQVVELNEDNNECRDEYTVVSACREGTGRDVRCIVDGRPGSRHDRCVHGIWQLGICVPNTACREGDERWGSCWMSGRLGYQLQVCRHGAWVKTGGCLAHKP
jgi:subtilisin family serine protease